MAGLIKIDFHRNFDKRFSRLSKKSQEQFKKRLELLAEDRFNPLLNSHALKGSYEGYRSINVTGDIRAVFIAHSDNHVEFVEIGSHSQLYG